MKRWDDKGGNSANWIIEECIRRGMHLEDDGATPVLPSGKRRPVAGFPIINGYRVITLTANQVWRSILWARIVCWFTYGPPAFPRAVVDHINQDKLNDSPANLRWATLSQNIRNTTEAAMQRRGAALKNTRKVCGSESGAAKLTEEKVANIRLRGQAGERARDMATEFGVSDTTIYYILRRQTWRHVGDGVTA